MSLFRVEAIRAGIARATSTPAAGRPPAGIPGIILATLVLFGSLVAPAAAEEMNFLSMLFGGPANQPAAARPDTARSPRTRAVAGRSRTKHPRAMTVRETAVTAAKPGSQSRPAGSQPASPLADTTLRRGDVVMTADGLRVFRGARHFPYVADDFQPLALAGKSPHRTALLAIDKASRTRGWSTASASPAGGNPAPKMSRVPDPDDKVATAPEYP